MLFCAEIYLGRVYIAVQDSAVTFANAITRFFIFSQLLWLSYILMGGKSAPRIFLKWMSSEKFLVSKPFLNKLIKAIYADICALIYVEHCDWFIGAYMFTNVIHCVMYWNLVNVNFVTWIFIFTMKCMFNIPVPVLAN